MSQKLTPKFTPLTAADVVDADGVPGWASRVKAAVTKDGQALRVGIDCSIEAKSLTRDIWQPIMLPNGGHVFTDASEATLVLRMITGEEPIPNIVTSTTP